MKIFLLSAIVLLAQFLTGCGCTIVDPGERGVKVTLGSVTEQPFPEGLHWHTPLITSIYGVSVKQQTQEMKTECYSSDLQTVSIILKVLYRIPEGNVVTLFQKYAGDPFESLIAPRISEAFKEATATESAENIVKKREAIKMSALEATKRKIGDLLFLEDIAIANVDLSDELEKAIEQKMVQEQEAAKSKFIQQKAEIEARTSVIKAQGEAEAIRIRGEAIKSNPKLIDLQIVEKWNGVTPLVIGSGSSNILLPIKGSKQSDGD